MLYVHSIETFGTQDGPGIRMVVFLQGCQMRCLYCHNPDTQAVFSEKNKRRLGRLMSTEEIMDRLRGQQEFFKGKKGGGLTVSGGEPLLQAEGLKELLLAAKAEGFHTAVDSNGGIETKIAREALRETDLLLLDVKQINSEKHRELTGKENEATLRTAAWREKEKGKMWLRYVLVPGWSDAQEDLEAWAKHFQNYKMVERVEILPFHQLGKTKYERLEREYLLAEVEAPDTVTKKRARETFEKYLGARRVVLK